MTTPTPIEQHILEVTGLRYRSKDRKANLEALAEAVEKLDDERWRKLKPPAQDWYNRFCDAFKNGGEIIDFAPDERAEPAAKEDQVVKPKKAAVNGHDRRPSKLKPGPRDSKPKAAAGRARASSGEGGPAMIRRMVMNNPRITREELEAKLAEKDKQISRFTVATTRSDMVAILRMLHENGKLKNMKL